MTTKRRQWLTSLVSAQPTHKSGLTIYIYTTQTQMTYLINKASHALSDMLWRKKGSWLRMKKTSRALNKILGLCNLWTLGLGNGTSLTLLLPLHTKRMSIIHLYLHCIFTPRSGQSSSSYPLVRQVANYVGKQSQLLLKILKKKAYWKLPIFDYIISCQQSLYFLQNNGNSSYWIFHNYIFV